MNQREDSKNRLRELPVERIPADLREAEDGWALTLALPDVEEADIELTVEEGELRIRATRPDRAPAENTRVLRSGPPAASLERDFVLPEGVEVDAINAELDAGLLRVHIARPTPERRTIPVRTS